MKLLTNYCGRGGVKCGPRCHLSSAPLPKHVKVFSCNVFLGPSYPPRLYHGSLPPPPAPFLPFCLLITVVHQGPTEASSNMIDLYISFTLDCRTNHHGLVRDVPDSFDGDKNLTNIFCYPVFTVWETHLRLCVNERNNKLLPDAVKYKEDTS